MSKAQKKGGAARRQRSNAELPLQLALAFLRAHQWWEGVAPRLPPRLAAAVTAALFTVTGAPGGLEAWRWSGGRGPRGED